ncbi:hypothetical protein DFH11DRAFT_1731497 [Phellopilus nigrolimitatus]|nr:hypothetical protein DFH11DRAFT_1731497 [Phellopilus nigrolimitatus]
MRVIRTFTTLDLQSHPRPPPRDRNRDVHMRNAGLPHPCTINSSSNRTRMPTARRSTCPLDKIKMAPSKISKISNPTKSISSHIALVVKSGKYPFGYKSVRAPCARARCAHRGQDKRHARRAQPALYDPDFDSGYASAPGEDTSSRAIANERFRILHPTIELLLDEIRKDVSRSDSPDGWSSGDSNISSGAYDQHDVEMRNAATLRLPPRSHSAREVLSMTIHPAQVSPLPTLARERPVGAINSSALLSGVSLTAPGRIKAECNKCGATHTPL